MSGLDLLAGELGVHERTLRRAINAGSLHATRWSPRTLELSAAERRYVRHAWPLISTLSRALRTEHNVRFALLYGSAARGTDTSDSDVDLLVAMRDASLDRVVDLEAKLSAALARRVDIVRLEDARRSPSFLANATREGRVLVDRDARWPRLRKAGGVRQGADAASALAAVDALLTRSARG